MENCKAGSGEQRPTLMQAYERLDEKCRQLKEVAGMTTRLNEKLNRTEDRPKCENELMAKEANPERNIVELFNFIAEKLESQINVIGSNAEKAMGMID